MRVILSPTDLVTQSGYALFLSRPMSVRALHGGAPWKSCFETGFLSVDLGARTPTREMTRSAVGKACIAGIDTHQRQLRDKDSAAFDEEPQALHRLRTEVLAKPP